MLSAHMLRFGVPSRREWRKIARPFRASHARSTPNPKVLTEPSPSTLS